MQTTTTLTLRELFDAYLVRKPEEFKRGKFLKDKTKKQYLSAFRHSRSWVNRRIDMITKQMAITRYESLKRGSPAEADFWRKLHSAMYIFAMEKGWVAVNPFIAITKALRHKPVSRNSLSDEELKAWWKAANAADNNVGDAMMVCLLTGLPKADVYNLKWKHVSLEGRTVKAGDKTLPLTERVATILEGRNKDGTYIFGFEADIPLVTDDNVYREIARNASVEVTPSRLKATFKAYASKLPITHFGMASMTKNASYPPRKVRADYEAVASAIVRVATR